MENETQITCCRACGNENLKEIISLGDQYVSNFVEDSSEKTEKHPLDLVLCDPTEDGGCGLLQLNHNCPAELMWDEQYWYKSAISSTITKDLKDIVYHATGIINLNERDCVIDIGSNDGTLLENYGPGVEVVGFEPSKNVAKEAMNKGIPTINNFFNAKDFYLAYGGEKKAKIITAISMFYDLEDPNAFLRDIVSLLDKDGLFIIQQNYLMSMLTKNAFDNICFKPNTMILGCNKQISKIQKSDKVFGMKGSLVNVKNIMKRKYNGDMININPKYLESMTTTPEHPVRIVKRESIKFDCGQSKPKIGTIKPLWVEAKEVRKNDYMVIPRIKPKEKIKEISLKEYNKTESSNYRKGLLSLPLNKETAWMIGLYTAQGHTNKMQPGNINVCFTLNIKETDQAEKLSKLFKKLGYKTNIKEKEETHVLNIKVSCTALARALKEWIGPKAIKKKVPDFIMFAPKDIKIAYLRGLFDGDGYQKGNKIHFHTSSKVLSLQTQLLIASLGGMVNITRSEPSTSVIRGGIVNSKESWQLRGSSKILGEIFDYEYKGTDREQFVMNKDFIFVPVKSVETEQYNGMVHNIETEDNTYLVSNAIFHNCHEHREYYSLYSLKQLLEKHGLEIFDVLENDINGGSIRTYIKFKDNDKLGHTESYKRVNIVENMEIEMGIDDLDIYYDFVERIEKIKEDLLKFLTKEKEIGKEIYIYGASTRGNVILQYFGLDTELITAAVDKNPDKHGKKTVGTLIPIISPEEFRQKNPDHLLVMTWHFYEEIKEQEKEWFNRGGEFIIPLPIFKRELKLIV